MAIAFDAVGTSGIVSSTDPIEHTHTPVGTPRGVLIFVSVNNVDSDVVGTVTYGGVTCTEVSESPAIQGTGEKGLVAGFFLGSGIPTGPQTVSIGNTGASARVAYSYTLTADADLEVVDSQGDSNANSNAPSVALTLGGRTCFLAAGLFTGVGVVTAINVLSADWSNDIEDDFGVQCAAVGRRTSTSAVDQNAGFTLTGPDEWAVLGVAIAEVAAAAGNPWYAYAQMRVKTELERTWKRRGRLWEPAYTMRRKVA